MPAAHPDHGITTKRLRRPRLVIPTRRRHRNPAAKDHLQQGVIYLKHVASRQFVEYPLRNGLITIGRSDDTQGIQPDIDLTPLKAQIHGVSRLHAGLRYERNQLYLKDMGSVNGTFYNGRKLIPESYRLVASGSHLQFGSLGLRIGFNSTTQ
ncbi:MAG: FHA domain-containing protein [Chloroflexota bacterium]